MSSEEDWIKSCRGCLTKSNLVSIFDERDEIRTKFQDITTIAAEQEDGLPAYLCLDCLDTLNFVHQFKKECLKIDKDLRNKLIKKNKTTNMKQNKENSSCFNVSDTFNPKMIKQEILDDDEIDDNSYYVVVIEEQDGEKVVKALKIENVDDMNIPSNVKQEKLEVVDNNETEIEEEIEGEVEEHGVLEEDIIVGSEAHEMEGEETILPDCETILQEGEDLDQNKLNLIQMLATHNEDGNIIQYEDGMSLVGEGGEEVVVSDVNGEYHLITPEGDIAVLGEDEETITVMQQEDGSFLCDCGEAYMDFADYEEHIAIHNTHKCTVCERGFESQAILAGHSLLHESTATLLRCPFCDTNVKRGMMTTHIKLNHNNAAVNNFCHICKKLFRSEAYLKRHMNSHNPNKKFECNICFKRFAQKTSMETHRATHAEAFLKCALCARDFDNEEEFAQHQKEGCVLPPVDRTDKPNVCDMCGKHYASATSLKAHIEMTHGQSMEILCSECGEVLPSRRAMYTHSLTHRQQKPKNLKRFACETCGKCCASHAMLLMHERVHTNERPYPCQKCPLAFKTKTHLSTHQLTHTQEKRFGCSVCMKFFALKGNLVVHLRTHTGERPYVCSICNQGFIDSKYLKKHKQKRHDITNLPWNQYY